MTRETSVFISYARSDGEVYATELRDRLKSQPGIDLWQDRTRMESGDFEQQIRQAIDSVRYLVVVLTPGALRSEWVENEWRYARENGVCICPIKPKFASQSTEDELNALHSALPRWMQQVNVFDFERYWNRFLQVLESPCNATRVACLAPGVPANFVQRRAQFTRIIAAILDAGHGSPSGKKVVLYGSGGFGKTTLAASVCREEDVFAACDGGILWATLGSEPSLISELTKIYAGLTGERPQFVTLDDAMFAVEKKIEGKRCLLVIDDVWESSHLKPFLHGGANCARLITTRRFGLAVQEAEEAYRINVAELEPDEGEAVLEAGLNPPPGAEADFHKLARRLGGWPLLMQLANRTLREQVALGESVADALQWGFQVYHDFGATGFDREGSKEREDAIRNTVELSLGLLTQDRARCLELAIFAEDTDIPLDVVGLVWQTDPMATRRLAQRMHDLALIKLDLSRKSGVVAAGGCMRLHDAMRAYFAAQLTAPALLHGRLADTWKDPRRITGDYALQYIAYHLAEAMADPAQVIARGWQLVDLLTSSNYRGYQEQHGDPALLHRQITLALKWAAAGEGPDAPALVASLALLQQSYAEAERDPALIFKAAAAGRIREAVERLDLFEAEPEWNTLARLLIAWMGASSNPLETKALLDGTAAACDRPELLDFLAWVQSPGGTAPPFAAPRFAHLEGALAGRPDLPFYVSMILQRAGGAETPQGLEPIDVSHLASGVTGDASAFIADQDGPPLLVFAQRDPAANTQYLERYIDIHAANRYRYYRNRSLWALLKCVLAYPDAAWIRAIVQRIVAAALVVTHVDFEEFLPLAVRGLAACWGDPTAAAELDAFRQRLSTQAAYLGRAATAGPQAASANDFWSHFHRRACILAEIYGLALDRSEGAADPVGRRLPAELLELARRLPKGFAGFRAFSALTEAESAELSLPGNRAAIDAALESAQAASHRIQDYHFCLRTTAMVNAMRSRWWNQPIDVKGVVERFVNDPLAEKFCAVHRVLEDFAFRSEPQFQSLPIPIEVLNAETLRQIASAYQRKPETLAGVNPGLGFDVSLGRNDEINLPELDFIPILAARFASAALAAPGLSADQRSALIQSLVPLAVTNRTALDTVLARLLLSARGRAFVIPDLLRSLPVPHGSAAASASETLTS